MSHPRIATDPGVLLGKPCVKGTRISVEYILELLEDGHHMDGIVAEHPGLERADVEAAIAYARDAVRRSQETAAK